ncbi:DUF1127 domain-containing protein [Ferirhizobium litorale]
MDGYIDTIDTMYPDGYARETFFRDAGDMVDPPPGQADGYRGVLGRLWAAFCLWQEKRSSRLLLRDLTDEQLRDIGVTRSEAEDEVRKSFFWD